MNRERTMPSFDYIQSCLQEGITPKGYKKYAGRAEVECVHHYRRAAKSFVNSKNKWVEFHRDHHNKQDSKAIKVVGCSKGFLGTKRRLIGYLEKDLAKTIIAKGFEDDVYPLLEWENVIGGGHVQIVLEIIGPNDFDTYSRWVAH